MRFLFHWAVVTLAVAVAAYILPGVHVASLTALLVGGLVLGFANAVLRPIAVFFTLPLTLVTLGLFLFVINGAAFALAAWIVDGFAVDSFGWAIAGSLVVSLVSWLVERWADD